MIDSYLPGYAEALESDTTHFGAIIIILESLLEAPGLLGFSLFYSFKGPGLAAGFLHQADVGNGHGAIR